jgi:hypothetical protein
MSDTYYYFLSNMYHILIPYKTFKNEMIVKCAFEWKMEKLNQSPLLYLWCIFIEFHYYKWIFILNP